MRRIALLATLGLITIALIAPSCGKKKVADETPVVTQPTTRDTTPAKPETPPTPVEKPKLQESQFQTIYFDYDKYNLRSDARSGLDANFKLLQEFPDVIVKIEGHCDERGTVEYNLSLGEKRARSAMDYLTGLGIASSRISIISYGKERPAVMGSNEDAWSKNRRCEFKIISQ